MAHSFGIGEIIAAAALVVAIVFGIPLIYSFVKDAKWNKSNREMEARIDEVKKSLVLHDLGNVNIVACLTSMEETILMYRAIFEEVAHCKNEKLEKANDLFYAQKKRVMKLIHHTGLTSSDGDKALRSSWALATEFGEADTLELMTTLEHLHNPGHSAIFRAHKIILSRRLGMFVER